MALRAWLSEMAGSSFTGKGAGTSKAKAGKEVNEM